MQLPPRQRAQEEYDSIQHLKNESLNQPNRYLVMSKWLDRWYDHIETVKKNGGTVGEERNIVSE